MKIKIMKSLIVDNVALLYPEQSKERWGSRRWRRGAWCRKTIPRRSFVRKAIGSELLGRDRGSLGCVAWKKERIFITTTFIIREIRVRTWWNHPPSVFVCRRISYQWSDQWNPSHSFPQSFPCHSQSLSMGTYWWRAKCSSSTESNPLLGAFFRNFCLSSFTSLADLFCFRPLRSTFLVNSLL